MPGSLLGESSHSLLGREVPKNALGVMPFLWGVMPDSLLGGRHAKEFALESHAKDFAWGSHAEEFAWGVIPKTLLGGVMLKSLLGESCQRLCLGESCQRLWGSHVRLCV